MRKRDLLRRCTDLFEQLQQENLKNERLAGELERARAEIDRLNAAVSSETAAMERKEQLRENRPVTDFALSEDVAYGAQVIGKIVVSSAECANRLTAGGSTEYRELVKLILGQAEIAKGKILEIVSSESSLEEKKKQADSCFCAAQEYFASVMQQRSDLENESL